MEVMRLPESVTILGKEIPIYRRNLSIEKAMGLTDGNAIIICETCPKHFIMEVLLHEMGHALLFRLGLHNTSLPLDLEEIIVDNYARMMLEVFKISKGVGCSYSENSPKKKKR